MPFWNDLHMRTRIFVHDIDWKQHEVAPYWFKFEDISAVICNKFNYKRWKSSEIKTNSDVSLKSK